MATHALSFCFLFVPLSFFSSFFHSPIFLHFLPCPLTLSSSLLPYIPLFYLVLCLLFHSFRSFHSPIDIYFFNLSRYLCHVFSRGLFFLFNFIYITFLFSPYSSWSALKNWFFPISQLLSFSSSLWCPDRQNVLYEKTS